MLKAMLRYLLNMIAYRILSVLAFLRYHWWGLFFNKLGENVRIYGGITVMGAQCISIGDNCTINKYTFMTATKDAPLIIGNNVRISPNVILLTSSLQYDEKGPRIHFAKGVVIENNVWLGCGSTVLPGIHIGQNSVVGAGSVVTKDIPPDSVVGGVPARVIKRISFREKAEGNAVPSDSSVL